MQNSGPLRFADLPCLVSFFKRIITNHNFACFTLNGVINFT